MKPKIKVDGAEFERVIHAAPRSAHAPRLFLKPAHRSAPAPAIFDPLRSVFRSAHAPLTLRSHALLATIIDVAGYGALALGHVPPSTYNSLFFSVYFDLAKSDSDDMLTVAWCIHPVTFVPLLAPNSVDATGYDRHAVTKKAEL